MVEYLLFNNEVKHDYDGFGLEQPVICSNSRFVLKQVGIITERIMYDGK